VPTSIPYADLTVGIVRETYPNERRVAVTPQNAALLLKKGFARVLVERGAGAEAQFTDHAYEQAGVTLVEGKTVWSESDILLKVRAPSIDGTNNEVNALRVGGTIISFLYPLQNRNVVEKIASRGATAFAMDMIPRISRAQVFDALRCVISFSAISWTQNCLPCCFVSSMANIAGYKAVLEASNHFGRFLTGQVTAAG
jgi:H+-translocating NAD(P) transhydrogenase